MYIQTERLLLRPLNLQDAPAIQKYFPHWEIVQHLSAKTVKWPYPPDGAQKFLQNIALPAMARGDDWYFGITLKGDAAGEVIGVVHLRRDTAAGNRGVWLASGFQGKGYMQEAVGAVNDLAFGTLDFDKMVIKNAADNEASRRLKQKTAARHVATVPASHYIGGSPAQEIWELTAADWRAFRTAQQALARYCRPQAAPAALWTRRSAAVQAFGHAAGKRGSRKLRGMPCRPCAVTALRPLRFAAG
ncbi:MAG: GNAT family N-acetyltransferase [Alphaproteobacteria bacterium]|nr:GNAT family N-acetyltransferase [Alphaproteobacteria bacterium]